MNPDSLEDALNLVANFADKFVAAAEGHAREELTPEQEAQLRNLANGGLSEEDRAAVITLLAHNEVAMEFLAKTVT